MKDNNELSLIQQVVRGNRQAFDQLFNNYSPDIYNFISKLVKNQEEADDILQETFLRAWKYRKKISLELDFSRWLYQIAHNCCRNFFRPKIIRFFSLSDLFSNEEDKDFFLQRIPDPSGQNPQQKNKDENSAEELKKIIRMLPAKYRMIVVLRYQQEMSYEEIAEITNYPLGTVKTYLFRAHKILQKKLKQNHQDKGI